MTSTEKQAMLAKVSAIQIRVAGLRGGKTILHDALGVYRDAVLATIKDAPTTDVIRCKDCKWYGVDATKGQFCLRVASPSMWQDGITPLRPDDYCSYAERRKRHGRNSERGS